MKTLSNGLANTPMQNQKLPVSVTWLKLRFLTQGHVNGWLGPAIRGLVLKPLRERLCLLDERQQAQRSAALSDPIQERYCLNCDRMAQCAYGRIFEPDRLLISGRVHRGAREGLRGITIGTPCYDQTNDSAGAVVVCSGNGNYDRSLNSVQVQQGDVMTVRLLQIGHESIRLGTEVVKVMNASGRTRGIGPDRVRFEIDRPSASGDLSDLCVDSLPLRESLGSVPILKIQFDAPIFLKTKVADENNTGRSRRRFSDANDSRPTISVLFRESLRTVRRAVNEFLNEEWAVGADMRFLIQSADNLKTIESNLQPFRQPRSSGRQERRWQLTGWRGSLTIADVPLHLLPYLQWAGRLGVGDSRNCGAGLWRLVLA